MVESKRIVLVVITGLLVLALLYIFQQINVGLFITQSLGLQQNEYLQFVINKTLRLLLNDFVCFVMICLIFKEREYRQFGLWVFGVELLIILPAYLFFKLTFEGYGEISNPLLSFVHRLIVNPMLMIITMIALGYQKFTSSKA
jgi:exosortase F-associated protein